MNMRLYKILSRKGCFLTPNRSFFGEFVIQNPVIKVTSWTCQKNRKFVHSSLRLPETETCMQIVWCDADLISAVYNIVISHGLLDIWIQHFEKLRKFVVVVPFCFISILDPIFADVPPFVELLSNEAWLRVFFGSLRGNPYTVTGNTDEATADKEPEPPSSYPGWMFRGRQGGSGFETVKINPERQDERA